MGVQQASREKLHLTKQAKSGNSSPCHAGRLVGLRSSGGQTEPASSFPLSQKPLQSLSLRQNLAGESTAHKPAGCDGDSALAPRALCVELLHLLLPPRKVCLSLCTPTSGVH